MIYVDTIVFGKKLYYVHNNKVLRVTIQDYDDSDCRDWVYINHPSLPDNFYTFRWNLFTSKQSAFKLANAKLIER